jgi:U3 small nucleolar RNA-associated protein 3
MQRLLTLKQSVSTLEDLGFSLSDSEPEFDEDDDESLDLTDDENMEGLWQVDKKKGLEPGELDGLLKDAKMSVSFAEPIPRAIKAQPLEDKPPKKKRKLSSDSSKTAVYPIFDLEEPEFTPSSKTSSRPKVTVDLDDAFGEATHLKSVDAADKSARKKSLRFHTSKIESTSARRQGARNQAMGGDDDIPYRERQKDKETRLLREAKNRIANQGGEDIDDSEPPERMPGKRRRDDDSDGEDGSDEPDSYYKLVKKKTKETKEKKKSEYDAARAAERSVNLVISFAPRTHKYLFQRMVEEASPDGPRSITRAILTNKGLTPHRPKAVRNPRVKKRQKFEKAKKKLTSQKAVYKGGLSQTGGRYDGEKSGISKVVKSVKLG